MKALIYLLQIEMVKADFVSGYIIGAVAALLILGYLVYALLRPEKF